MSRVSHAALRAARAAYAPAATEREWLEGLCAALDSAGIGSWYAYATDGRRFRTATGAFEQDQAMLQSFERSMPPVLFAAAHVPAPVIDSSRKRWRRIGQALGMSLEEIEGSVGPRIPERTGIFCFGADARGALLAVDGESRFGPRTRHALSAVAAHITTAHRLRERLAVGPDVADAVCSPSGTLLHASQGAAVLREPLARAVKRFGRATRGAMRRLDHDEAIAAWTAMVEGRWTLVDHIDTDGKHTVLGHCNAPPANITGLRGNEARVTTLAAMGHSNKWIAYELGLAISTTATLLRSALIKLGLRDRRELVRVLGPLARLRRVDGNGPLEPSS